VRSEEGDTIMVMTMVTKSQLKARMLALFREVESSGEPLIVTDRGRPVLKVVPIEEPAPGMDTLFADVRTRLAEKGVRYSAEEATEPLDEEAVGDADWYGS